MKLFSYFLCAQEALVFPFLTQKMDFAPEKEAHEVIHKDISDLEALLNAFKADHTKFEPSQIKELLEQLKEPLVGVVSVFSGIVVDYN